MINYWPLIGIALVVGLRVEAEPDAGRHRLGDRHRADRRNGPVEVVSTFGKAFNDNRIIAIVWIVLPVIGLLERFGLQQRARQRDPIAAQRHDRALLILYLLYRQITAAIGSIRPPAIRRRCRPWSRRWRSRRPRNSMAN